MIKCYEKDEKAAAIACAYGSSWTSTSGPVSPLMSSFRYMLNIFGTTLHYHLLKCTNLLKSKNIELLTDLLYYQRHGVTHRGL